MLRAKTNLAHRCGAVLPPIIEWLPSGLRLSCSSRQLRLDQALEEVQAVTIGRQRIPLPLTVLRQQVAIRRQASYLHSDILLP